MRYTLKNAARVAVMQVIIVVLGILGTGASESWWVIAGQPMPAFTHGMIEWGVLLLLIPAVWICWAARIIRDRNVEDELKRLVFLSGFVLTCALFFLMALSTLYVFGSIADFNPTEKADGL
ncbi:MAG: hypothetical protein FJ405_08265 [Verrucomicrobia bacterium]|nr:hypothetical protein [Verrucomicrobiota bacterium]